MNISLSIERLILEGLPLGPEAVPLLQASLEAELSRLLGQGSLAPSLGSSVAVPRLHAGVLALDGSLIEASAAADPANLGVQIAQVVYSSLGGQGDTTQAAVHGLDR